jgi:hypothetical protein
MHSASAGRQRCHSATTGVTGVPHRLDAEADQLGRLRHELKQVWQSREEYIDTKFIQGVFQRVERRAYIAYLESRLEVAATCSPRHPFPAPPPTRRAL